jgi:hypothetical protein
MLPAFEAGHALGYYGAVKETANGAQTAGASTLVVNGAITPGTAASGEIHVRTSSGFLQRVTYSSWSGSTFTLTINLPNNVANGASVFTGDTVHFTDTGVAAFASAMGILAKQAAGTFTLADVGTVISETSGTGSSVTSGEFNSWTDLVSGTFDGPGGAKPDVLTADDGQLVADFASTERFASSRAASSFNLLHDATSSAELFVRYRRTSAVPYSRLAVTNIGATVPVGLSLYFVTTDTLRAVVGNGSTTSGVTAPRSHVLNTWFTANYRKVAAAIGLAIDTDTVVTGTITSPSASAPETTLHLGNASNGSGPLDGQIGYFVLFSVALPEWKRKIVRDYLSTTVSGTPV